jgi:hypothetical protein
MTIIWFLIAVSIFVSGVDSPIASAQQAKKPFTVADEIGLTLFGDPNGGPPEVHFSPDGKYFAVWTERGRLGVNRVEDSLRFYRSQDVEYFLEHPVESQPPSVAWVVNLSTNTEGPIISDWRWLPDSSGVAFLERMAGGNRRLVLADLRKKTIESLTPTSHVIKTFDIRDRQHYVYTVADPAEAAKSHAEREGPATVGTGHSIYELLFPNSPSGGQDSVSPQY